jgi:hypothetical protein
MRRLLLAALAAAVLALPATATLQRQIIGAEQDHSLAEATDCEHFYKTTFTSFAAEVQEQEQRELPMAGLKMLKVRASEEGGVSIRGWEKPFARLVVCKYAGAETKAQAQKALQSITVSSDKGEVTAQGPAIDQTQVWWVNLILYVPRKVTIDVTSSNGGIAIRNLNGTVTARATNGGVSVTESTGDFTINTESGGVTLERIGGRVTATTQNGPIALKVKDAKAPPPMEVKTGRNGDIVCNLKACTDAPGNLRAEVRVLRVGSAAPAFRLTTLSAPILIDQAR